MTWTNDDYEESGHCQNVKICRMLETIYSQFDMYVLVAEKFKFQEDEYGVRIVVNIMIVG